jgi:hypothetical protein
MFHYVVREPIFPEFKYQKFFMFFLECLLEVKGIFVLVFEEGKHFLVVLKCVKHVVLVDFSEIEHFGFPYLLSDRILDIICA